MKSGLIALTGKHISTIASPPKRTRNQWWLFALALAIILGVEALPSAQAQTLTVLYSFTSYGDGTTPSSVIRDRVGNLYGTTFYGGDFSCFGGNGSGCGMVFKLDRSGKKTVLHSFTGNADGAFSSDLIRDPAGNLYGTANEGGDLTCPLYLTLGCGTVYKLDATGKGTVLYTFA